MTKVANKPALRTEAISPFYVMALLQRAQSLEQEGKDIVHMEIGEPDFPTPPLILKAAADYLRQGRVAYTSAAGLPALRLKIADFYRQRYDVEIPPERIFITPGASGALLLALSASLNPCDHLLTADPCYPCNYNLARFLGIDIKRIPVTAAIYYQLTAELIAEHWTADDKGVLVASPSNPTGTLMSATMLRQTIEAVEARNGFFYSDEIYHGLTYNTAAQTALRYSDNVFVINSFSKYFGMTGWRLGWLIVPENFCEAIEKLVQNLFIAASSPAQYAALAAFEEDTLRELEQRRLLLAQRRDYLYNKLVHLGFNVPIKPEGAFYIYADGSAFTSDSYRFAWDLLEQQGVAVTPGRDFGRFRADEFIRFAYTTSIDRMGEALQRLENFIRTGVS